MYGVETSIDPDRIRLWHEDEINFPGLNISSFKTIQKVKNPVTGERTSKVDYLLQKGAVTSDRNTRITYYESFQKIINDEVPAVFLYHPKLIIAVNKRVKNIDLSFITLPEERYLNITQWKVE